MHEVHAWEKASFIKVCPVKIRTCSKVTLAALSECREWRSIKLHNMRVWTVTEMNMCHVNRRELLCCSAVSISSTEPFFFFWQLILLFSWPFFQFSHWHVQMQPSPRGWFSWSGLHVWGSLMSLSLYTIHSMASGQVNVWIIPCCAKLKHTGNDYAITIQEHVAN